MDRTGYIGSSDARDILYGSWFSLWQVKTGRAQPPDLSANWKVRLGRTTESLHFDWLATHCDSATDFVRLGDDDQRSMITRPHIRTRPDGMCTVSTEEAAARVPVELKHSSGRRSMDELLHFYMPQLQHHMLVTGADRCLFSVIRGASEPEWRWVGASDLWAKTLLDAYDLFWAFVANDEAPPMPEPGHAERVAVPSIDIVPIDGMVRRNATGDNAFTDLAVLFCATFDAARAHEAAKTALKGMVGSNEREVTLPGVLSIQRDARRALRFNILRRDSPAAAE